MGKLRERMERDLEIRGFSPNSRKAYLYRIKALARHFGRSPDQLSPEDIRSAVEIGVESGVCGRWERRS